MDEFERMKEKDEITKEVLRSLKMSLAIPDFSGITGGVPVELAAKVMGKEVDYIKQGIREEWLPIGVYTSGKEQGYYISPKLFWEFTGYILNQNQEGNKKTSRRLQKYKEEFNKLALPEQKVDELDKPEDAVEEMKKVLDKLCINSLCDMQQTFGKQIDIICKILYTELFDIVNHMTAAMDLCECYSNLTEDLLKAPDRQTDINLVYSHFSKIQEIFGDIEEKLCTKKS